MKKEWDKEEEFSRQIYGELEQIPWTSIQENTQLENIHNVLNERRRTMRYERKKMVVAAAAVMTIIGTITAAAAGKIVGLYSSSRLDEALTAEELEKKAGEEFKIPIQIEEQLAAGVTYSRGFITEVVGADETGNTVDTYSEAMADYGDYTLSMMLEEDVARIEGEQGNQNQEEYREVCDGIELRGWEDEYLFLPPDQEPKAEDVFREEAGELYISYGSEEEERCVFKNMVWKKNGIRYLLMTKENVSLEEMAEMAKVYVEEN